MASIGEAERHGNGGQLIFALNEHSSILRQFDPELFHDRRPRGDGVARAVTNPGGDEAQGHGGVAIRRHPRFAGSGRWLELEGQIKDVPEGIGISRIEGEKSVPQNGLILAPELPGDDFDETGPVQVKHAAQEAEGEHVLAAILGGSTDGFHRGGGQRHGHEDEAFVGSVWRDLVRIIETDAALAEESDVALVAVFVEGHQEIGLIPRAENLSRTDPNLENRRSTGNGRRDRHVGDHVLIGAAGEAGDQASDGLDPVLGISSDSDHGVIDRFGTDAVPSGYAGLGGI